MDQVILLLVEQIQVPEDRITSIYDSDKMEELTKSIKESGILQPLWVLQLADQYILVDGLHRLLAAKELGLPEVPCLVRAGTETEVLVKNLALNRQRGRSNPAQEAKTVKALQDERSIPVATIASLTGISEAKIRELLEIATLQHGAPPPPASSLNSPPGAVESAAPPRTIWKNVSVSPCTRRSSWAKAPRPSWSLRTPPPAAR